MEENTAELSLVEARINFIEAELNFIEIAVGSFAKDYPDEKKRKDFLKEELSLIPDESWRDQFKAYVRFSEEQLKIYKTLLQEEELQLQRKKVELLKLENLLRKEKVKLDLSAAQQDHSRERFIENPRFVKQMEHILNTPSETLLEAMQGEEYFKSFGRPVPKKDHVPSNIFIRRAYRELTYQVLHDLCICIKENDWYQQIITGTPGIGKSIFLSYLVHFLAQVDGITHIVIDYAQKSDSNQIFHFSRSGPNSSISANTSAPTYGKWRWSSPFPIDDATLYVSDPRAGDKPLPYLECHHIVICSPNIYYVRDLISKDAFPVMVMPVFSFEELVALNNLTPNKFNEEELVARYRKYGGVPRHVFGSEKYLKTMDSIMRYKISSLKVDQLVTISKEIGEGFLFFEANSIPNTLFHMVVGSDSGKEERKMLLESAGNMFDDDIRPVEPTLNYKKPVRMLGSPDYEQQFIGAVKKMRTLVSMGWPATDIEISRLHSLTNIRTSYMLQDEDKGNSASLMVSTIGNATVSTSRKKHAIVPLSSSRSSERRLENEDEYLGEQDTKKKVILSQTSSSHIPKQSRKSKGTLLQTKEPGSEEREHEQEPAVLMPEHGRRKRRRKKENGRSSSMLNSSVKMEADDKEEEEEH